ncbi:hypothetical protein Glove_226g2 [Diversispora epigaea]|uniref:Uncharacterized protein n=1 Tax=Diversispora epigaea TaxID=1348612 RepID=A0A397IHJ9_9GLOM|nr:hypothetical protein Glove_226g2 [Diversispora epigaea]
MSICHNVISSGQYKRAKKGGEESGEECGREGEEKGAGRAKITEIAEITVAEIERSAILKQYIKILISISSGQYKRAKKGGEESGEECGREGEEKGAGRAKITEIAEITVAEGHGRPREGSKRRRGSIRREENYRRDEIAKGHGHHRRLREGSTEIRESLRREESEELEERKIEKEVGKNKIVKITEITEIMLTKSNRRHRRLGEGNKGVKGSVKREEYNRREEKEDEEENKEEDKEEENMEDTEGWILENNSILNDNENNFLSFEMNLMNFISEEETPIASSNKNIIQKITMNRIKDNTNKKGIELNNYKTSDKNNKGDKGDEDNESDEDDEGNENDKGDEGDEGDGGDEDDESDEGEISNNNILSNFSRLQNLVALKTSFVWDFFITDHDTKTGVVYAICQVKDCTCKYTYHSSTTNYTKHLCDDHYITKALLSSKTPEEIKNLKQSKQ